MIEAKKFELSVLGNCLKITLPALLDRAAVLEAMNVAYGAIGASDNLTELIVDFRLVEQFDLSEMDMEAVQSIDTRNMESVRLDKIWFLILDSEIRQTMFESYILEPVKAGSEVFFIKDLNQMPGPETDS